VLSDWNHALEVATVVVVVLAMINMFRMTWYLVGADLFMVGRARAWVPASFRPSVTVVVPMHNEGVLATRTLKHLLLIDYVPLQIIVVDDGSTDDTAQRIAEWKAANDPDGMIEAFTIENGGKAHALNAAIRTRATGELIMCLDGDSILAPDAVAKSVAYFHDERVVATASNVNIIPNGTLLGMIQRFEYLICHQMKKAHSAYNVEYIVGGIGSTFRRSTMDSVGLYDTNTMTEDIDLTMKILAVGGNRSQRVKFAHDSLAYTEPVPSFPSLVKQRYRWKYGRMQTFWKNLPMFFSRDEKYSWGLSWFFLPFAFWQDLAYFLEPMIVTFILAVAVYFRSPATLIPAVSIISLFVVVNVLGTTHLTAKEKLFGILMAPLMYAFFYVLSVVEYAALVKSAIQLPGLGKSLGQERVTWTSPERVRASE
jgi:cellulose synthase/poly-beta-1,6-N-acetylglucosamine synthase-like glycosyltransferase